jgi:hypothetical protein
MLATGSNPGPSALSQMDMDIVCDFSVAQRVCSNQSTSENLTHVRFSAANIYTHLHEFHLWNSELEFQNSEL